MPRNFWKFVFFIHITCNCLHPSPCYEDFSQSPVTPWSKMSKHCYKGVTDYLQKYEVVANSTNISSISFISHSIYLFLEGDFYLTQTVVVRDVRNLTIVADGIVIIHCESEGIGLKFINITLLKISGIHFVKCGTEHTLDNEAVIMSALVFVEGQNLHLSSVEVSESYVSGISIIDVAGNSTINESCFSHAIRLNDNYTQSNLISYFQYADSSKLKITNSHFTNNSLIPKSSSFELCDIDKPKHLAGGLSIILHSDHIQISIFNVTLSENTGCGGGNLALLFYSTKFARVYIEESSITAGHAIVGGGIFVFYTGGNTTNHSYSEYRSLDIRNCIFLDNEAEYVGGAIYLKNKAFMSSTDINIDGCHFQNNSLNRRYGEGGYAIHSTTFSMFGYDKRYTYQLQITISSSEFKYHANDNRAIGNAVIFLKRNTFVQIINVNITFNNCSGILAISSNIIMSNKTYIAFNTALAGGGIQLCAGSFLYFKPYTNIAIKYNSVELTGGGINVETQCIVNTPQCFFQLTKEVRSDELVDTINVTVQDNHAMAAGDNLFGGSIDFCYILQSSFKKILFRRIFAIPNNTEDNPSSISSSPQQVCLILEQNTLECSGPHSLSDIYPGQIITLEAVLVGQQQGSVGGTAHAQIKDRENVTSIDQKEIVQGIAMNRSNLSFTIYSSKGNLSAHLLLFSDSSPDEFRKKEPFVVNIFLQGCPLWFIIEKKGCICNPSLSKFHDIFHCNITNKVILKQHNKGWIGATKRKHAGSWIYTEAIAVVCPLNYCDHKKVPMHLLPSGAFDFDNQCNSNRMGVLCGTCKNGSSLILGSTECREDCSNISLLWVIAFAFAGLFLVFIITVLNLTVSEGKLSGLLFYANITEINSFWLFENKLYITQFFRILNAWLNLDLGLRVCFYQGMSSVAKTILQFVFPVYIWAISGAIIILSRRNAFMARIFGPNSVKVLATLILMSYTKILRAARDSLHFTVLHFPTVDQSSVRWTLNGQQRYFEDMHVVVCIVGLIFGLICLPFAFILLCIQQLPRLSKFPLFCWIDRLKPFFDAYTGPFTDDGRCWTGLLLVLRMVILTIYSFNVNETYILKDAITIVLCCLLLFSSMCLRRGIYVKFHLNIIEYSFIFNLIFLLLGLITFAHYKKDIVVLVNISAGVAYISFFGIIISHIIVKFKCQQLLRKFLNKRRQSQSERERRVSRNDNMVCYPPLLNFDEEQQSLLGGSQFPPE